MNPTIQIPYLPPLKPDGTFDTPAVQRFLEDMQKTLRDKQLADYNAYKSLSGSSDVVSADYIIMKDIENLVVHWALVDPLNLDICYQVCDGSAWRSGSYAETFWTPKGLTKIPNLCGYGLRASDRGTTQNDPDRDDRRQAVTGLVLTGGLTVSLPAFYCNIIKEARDKGRTVQIGINSSDIFGTLSPVSTVTAVDLTTNIVTVTSGSALTVGATELIIKGDCIGSFQNDAMQRITGNTYPRSNHGFLGDGGPTGVFYYSPTAPRGAYFGGAFGAAYDILFDSSRSTSPNKAKTSDYETRGKNISYLPIMWVLLPSQSLVSVGGEIRGIDELIEKIGANSYVSQIVQNHVTDIYDYAFTATRASATVLDCLTTSITTVKKESKIAVDFLISGETHHDGAIILERGINGVYTEIGSAVSAGSRYYGISPLIYDSDNATTMSNYNIRYVDTPNVDVGTVITYRVKVYGEGTGGFNVNHVSGDIDSGPYERATSNVSLTEFAGTPNINFGDTDIASVSEAKAGVDNTKVITPYGLRQALNAEGSAPVYACRAWVNFNGTANVAGDATKNVIRGSGNVSSITDEGIGKYTVNFTTPMNDANYSVQCNGTIMDGTDDTNQLIITPRRGMANPLLVSSVALDVSYRTATPTTWYDGTLICVMVFR